MERQKRPFYIIAHNPNSLEEAKEYLDLGANALEPDVVFADGVFYVSHHTHRDYSDAPLLTDYLNGLKHLLLERNYNLALLIFDIKDANFDPNELIKLIKENFSGEPCNGVAMLLTHADDHAFLSRYKGNHANVGIGVDESNVPPAELASFFQSAGQKNFSYADGITTILTKPGVFDNITAAQRCRKHCDGEAFQLIYTWVLEREASMRKYLDTYIDGIFVDPSDVKSLKELISTKPYSDAFEPARNGYNPFTVPLLPNYTLRVKTKDQFLAGTDARIVFTLHGATGLSLQSLPYNACLSGALERDSVTYITLEGLEVGELESITVEALTDNINSAWLPEYIVVESKWLSQPVAFVFNSDGSPEEWISKKTGVVRKFPKVV